MPGIPYKSFCWSLGTTSFRTKNFNKTIEEQLFLLHEFWNLEQNQGKVWNGNTILQAQYYDFMKKRGFLSGNAKNKSKDAREKTSGLVDIGLIDDGRKLTEAGQKLLEISQNQKFASDNLLQIPSDSFIYLKQLLKTTCKVNGLQVRPLIVLLYLLDRLDNLSQAEFTYLLPLCTSGENTEYIAEQIPALRKGQISIDEIIINRLMNMDNYQSALEFFLNNNKVNEDLICTIGMNRKSRGGIKKSNKKYDRTYFQLFQTLHKVFMEKDHDVISALYNATFSIRIGIWWRKFLFNTSSKKSIQKNPLKCLQETPFSNIKTKQDFRKTFFIYMHLFKAYSTLKDYLDLNRRYFKTTNVFLFEDSLVKLDTVPKYFFKSVISQLYKLAFEPCENLAQDVTLEEISPCLVVDQSVIVEGINREFNTQIQSMTEANQVLESFRYKRLQHLIESRFSDKQILNILDLFANRKDKDINALITNDADIPTIFEYILGILWYKVSEFKGKVLNYMKLSLDADLLPKAHAGGGEADIVYEYEQTSVYPAHCLLLEATLADSTNQRRMEMEPVSRHLGQHLLKTGNLFSYSVFATNDLHINVISDFQSRKNTTYYDPRDYTHFVPGMKIIPLQISDLKEILIHKTKYKDLYPIFEEAFVASGMPLQWYKQNIQQKLQ